MKLNSDSTKVPKEWQTVLALYEQICAERQKDEIGQLKWWKSVPVKYKSGTFQIQLCLMKLRSSCWTRWTSVAILETNITLSLQKLFQNTGRHLVSPAKTGFCDVIEHKIATTDDIPVKTAHRRIPPQQWGEVREYLSKSLDTGIILESSSPYASPVVLVRKSNGKLRLFCDYRALNAKTRKGAPATFMRLMDRIFGDQNFQTLIVFMDDILVFGATEKEVLERLDMVLTRLSTFNLKVRPEKCQLFKEKIRRREFSQIQKR
ncbi:PREDICTED: uncharacterized protein LOC106805896 [Priapulus caudatus]|uniref:Uncharacterized protein LOC106805896 n=1 Tax=Priapulus caudatus TaxID=37621 RepID=A0ABM1DT81_PRICU|nr:PREDICTED: uncharacterized protein LOC106805896 [Priapulus caudatus]